MRTRKYLLAITVMALALVSAGGTALARFSNQNEKIKKVASGGIVPDKGKFRIVLDGHVVGSEEFEISATGDSWTARGSTSLRVPEGGDVKATGRLKFSGNCTPIRYDWSSQTQKKASGVVEFANGTAKTSIDLGGTAPFTQDFEFPSPRVAVLDNNLYHQYAVLAQLYDWKALGKQTFPVLIPQDLTPGSISVESLGMQQVEGAKYEALRVSSTDLEIMVYVNADHQLMRLEVPASKVTVQRE